MLLSDTILPNHGSKFFVSLLDKAGLFHGCESFISPHLQPLSQSWERGEIQFPFSQRWEKGLGDEGVAARSAGETLSAKGLMILHLVIGNRGYTNKTRDSTFG